MADPTLELDDEFARDLEFFRSIKVDSPTSDEIEVEPPKDPLPAPAPAPAPAPDPAPALIRASPVPDAPPAEDTRETDMLRESQSMLDQELALLGGKEEEIAPEFEAGFERAITEAGPERVKVVGPPVGARERERREATALRSELLGEAAYDEFNKSFEYAETNEDVANSLARLVASGYLSDEDLEEFEEDYERGKENLDAIRDRVPEYIRDKGRGGFWSYLGGAFENISDTLANQMEFLIEDPVAFYQPFIPRALKSELFGSPISEMEQQRDGSWKRRVLGPDDYRWWHYTPAMVELTSKSIRSLFGYTDSALDRSMRTLGLHDMANGAVMSSITAVLSDGPSDIIRDTRPNRDGDWARAVFSSGVALTPAELKTVTEWSQISSLHRQWEEHNDSLRTMLSKGGKRFDWTGLPASVSPYAWATTPFIAAMGGYKLVSGMAAGTFRDDPHTAAMVSEGEHASIKSGQPITTVRDGMGWIPLPPEMSRRKDLMGERKRAEVRQAMIPILKRVEDHVLHNRNFQKQRDAAAREYWAFINPAGWLPFAKQSTAAQIAGRHSRKFVMREFSKKGISKEKAKMAADAVDYHAQYAVKQVGPSEAYFRTRNLIQDLYRREAPRRVDDMRVVFDDKVGIGYGVQGLEIFPAVDLFPATLQQRIRPIKGIHKILEKTGYNRAATILGGSDGQGAASVLYEKVTRAQSKAEIEAIELSMRMHGSTRRAILAGKVQRFAQDSFDFYSSPGYFIEKIWREVAGLVIDQNVLERTPIARQFRTLALSHARAQKRGQFEGVKAVLLKKKQIEEAYRPTGAVADAIKSEIKDINSRIRAAKKAGKPDEALTSLRGELRAKKRELRGEFTTQELKEVLLAIESPRRYAKEIAPKIREVIIPEAMLTHLRPHELPFIDDLIAHRAAWQFSTDNMAEKYRRGSRVWRNIKQDLMMLDPYGDGNTIALRIRRRAMAEQRLLRKEGKRMQAAAARIKRGIEKGRKLTEKAAQKAEVFEKGLPKMRAKLDLWDDGADAARWVINGLNEALADPGLKSWTIPVMGNLFQPTALTKGKVGFFPNFGHAVTIVRKALGKDAPELRQVRSLMAKWKRRKKLKRDEMELVRDIMEKSHAVINSTRDDFLQWKPADYVKPGTAGRPKRPRPAKGVSPLDDPRLAQHAAWHVKTKRVAEEATAPVPSSAAPEAPAAAAAPEAPAAAPVAAAAAPEFKVEMFEAGNWRTTDGKFEIMKAAERYETNEKGWALGQWQEDGGTLDWGWYSTKREAVEYLRKEVYDPKGSKFDEVWGAKEAAPDAAPSPVYRSREEMQLGARTGMPLTQEDVVRFPPDPTGIPERAASRAVGAEPPPRLYGDLPDKLDEAVRTGRYDSVPDSILWHYGSKIDQWFSERLGHLLDEAASKGVKPEGYKPYLDEIGRKQDWIKQGIRLQKRANSTDPEHLVRMPAPQDTSLEKMAGHSYLHHVQKVNKRRIEMDKAIVRAMDQAERIKADMAKYGDIDHDKAYRMATSEYASEVDSAISSQLLDENFMEVGGFLNRLINRHPDEGIQSLADIGAVADDVMAGRPRPRPSRDPDPVVQGIVDDAVRGMETGGPRAHPESMTPPRDPVLNEQMMTELVSTFDPRVKVVDKALGDLTVWLKEEFADGLRLLHDSGFTMEEISAWIPHIVTRTDLIMSIAPFGRSKPSGVGAGQHRYWEFIDKLQELGMQPVDDARYAYAIWRATVESMLSWADLERKVVKQFGRKIDKSKGKYVIEGEGAFKKIDVGDGEEFYQALGGVRGMERPYVLEGDAYFVPREVAEGIDRMKAGYKGSEASLMQQVPVWRWATQVFKGLATGVFPRFHERNIISSMWNAWTYDVNDPAVYFESFKVLNTPGQVTGIAGEGIAPPAGTLAADRGVRWADEVIGSSDITRRQIREELNQTGILQRDAYAIDLELNTVDELRRQFGATTRAGKVFHGLQQVNPLSRQFAVAKAGKQIGSMVEDWLRAAAYIDGRVNKKMGVQEALERTIKIHFDYDDLTPFLRGMRDNVTPFSTWKRKNIALQLDALIKRPNKFYRENQLRSYVEALGDDDEVDKVWMPEFWSNMWGITVAKEDKGKKSLAMYRLGAPREDLNMLKVFLPRSVGGKPFSTVLADEFLASIYPMYKWPFEEKLDNSGHAFSFFKGRPEYDGRTEAPAWVVAADNIMPSWQNDKGDWQGFRGMMGLRKEKLSLGDPDEENYEMVWRVNESSLRTLAAIPPAYYANQIPADVGSAQFFLGEMMDLSPKQRARRLRVLGAVTPTKGYIYDPIYQKGQMLRDWKATQDRIRKGLYPAVPFNPEDESEEL